MYVFLYIHTPYILRVYFKFFYILVLQYLCIQVLVLVFKCASVDSYYVTTFLYGLRHFSTPYEVAVKLCKRFTMEVPPDASETERSYAAKWREIIQQRYPDAYVVVM